MQARWSVLKFMFSYKILFFIALLGLSHVESARILAVFNIPSKSHTILAYELFKELAKSGHEIVVIQPEGNELKNPPKNYRNIIVGDDLIKLFNEGHMDKVFEQVDENPLKVFINNLELVEKSVNITLKHPEVQEILNSKKKFDLVISELALNEAMFGFSEHFNCPHVLISTAPLTSWIETITGSPAPFSYVPHVFLDLTDKMNFIERLQNTIFNVLEDFLLNIFHYPRQKLIYENAFPNSKNFRPFYEKLRNGVSLVLINTHFTLNYPRPFVPNTVEVAGMHIKKDTKSLPDDIQKFIDNSDGVIYFSLGGNIQPSKMDKEKQKSIINALSKVKKEKILWKWDDEDVKVDKEKFLIKKWFPQEEILAHPKVKVFITHGGLLGGTEAVYNGKPLITIPIFGDQKLNAARAVLNGFGVRIDYANLTEESLSWALDEILNDSKYTIRVQELSKRFRDKPIHPVDLAKFHIEYIIRHKGAPFMQSSATNLNFIELNNLDVIAFIVIILIALALIPLIILRICLRKLFGTRNNVTHSKKKKN